MSSANMIEKIRSVAREVLPEHSKLYLYGSRARGDAHEGSDWDLLILLDKPSITTEDENHIAYPFVVAGWKNDAAISPQLYTFSEWEARSFTPYYKNVEHDKLLIQ